MKPLSKERLNKIAGAFSGRPDSEDPRLNYAVETITELIASEQFWRDAVKNCPMLNTALGQVEDSLAECPFCDAGEDYTTRMNVIDHKPDCPWLLAQD